ncbi:MAG: SIS domain-containing protein, partial [Planctomycetota bacterium]
SDETLRQAGRDLLDRIAAVMDHVAWGDLVELARMLGPARRTFCTGAGRSGLVARSFGMRLMHAGLPAFIPGETITPGAGAGDLLVAISCTGQTGYTDYIARRARELGAKVAVITADADSPLAHDADNLIVIPATAENIVIRAAVFEHATSLCLDAVFNVLAERLKLDVEKYHQRHANLE